MANYVDESGSRHLIKFLPKDEFRSWLMAQRKPSWPKFFCTHHTESPTEDGWRGASTIQGILNYYRDSRGFTYGDAPQFWVATESGPGSQWGVWIVQHPYYNYGIGAVNWNGDCLHMEVVHNGDDAPFYAEQLSVAAIVARAVRDWVGVPLTAVKFGSDGGALKTVPGQVFHRDCYINGQTPKTCPGMKNTHEYVFGKYQEAEVPATPENDWTPEALRGKELGLISGFPDGTFRPKDTVTRQQVTILMLRVFDKLMAEIVK